MLDVLNLDCVVYLFGTGILDQVTDFHVQNGLAMLTIPVVDF